MNFQDILLKHTTGNIFWKDRERRYLGTNQAFAELAGLKDPKEIIGRTDAELFGHVMTQEQLDQLNEIDRSVIDGDQERLIEESAVDKEGKTAYYLTKKIPLKDENGIIIGLIGTSVDITKEKKAKIAKDEFIACMSHDLRTPFCGLIGFSEFLEAQEDDPRKKEYLNCMKVSAEKLLEVLNDIISGIKDSLSEAKHEMVDLHKMLHDIGDLLKPTILFKHLHFSIASPPLQIYTDVFKLKQILTSLITNAVNFTEQGSIEVSATLYAKEIRILVKDTGIGISEEHLETIFDQFYKVKPSYLSEDYTGLGLGLYTAKQLAKQINAKIVVHSQLGRGSEFILLLNMS